MLAESGKSTLSFRDLMWLMLLFLTLVAKAAKITDCLTIIFISVHTLITTNDHLTQSDNLHETYTNGEGKLTLIDTNSSK